jgi:phosphate uptake regulator
MKRKVIQLAGKTLVISLPSKWAHKYNIKKGDSLEVEEAESKLVIGSTSELVRDKTQIDITNLKKALVWRYITAAYIKGNDELEIVYNNPKAIEIIQQIIPTLVGFVIIKEGKNYCIAKDLSGTTTTEFENVLRRTFLLLTSMAEDGLTAITKNNKDVLLNIRYRDYNINSFVNYCLRYLNKKGYKDFIKTPILYSIIRNLEFLGDDYSKMYEEIANSNIKINKENIKIIHKVNEMLRIFYELFYKFEKEKMIDLLNKKVELKEEINTLIKKKSPETKISIYLNRISNTIFDLGESHLVSSL